MSSTFRFNDEVKDTDIRMYTPIIYIYIYITHLIRTFHYM